MGVKGLWQLLLPTGRRISIETLSGKILAVDASIWLTQFLKANRDPETGAVRANAHLIGFLRRIAKLLFNGIRPVFVFDGATPEIKLREIRARRERRERLRSFQSEDDNEGVKRLARRLLIANLKKQKELEKAQQQMEDGKKVENPMEVIRSSTSKAAKNTGAFAPGFRLPGGEEEKENSSARTLNAENNKVVVEVSSSSPQHESVKEGSTSESIINLGDEASEDKDEILVLSDSEDYLKGLTQKQQNTNNDWDKALDAAETDSEESEGSIEIPDDGRELDMDNLANLPSKSRVDIIEKARRQQRMNSRREFMSVAANPESYSQCQLKNFLKSSKLNQKVKKLGKIDAQKGEDGLKGERIASDGSRRFIFTKDNSDDSENSDDNDDECSDSSIQEQRPLAHREDVTTRGSREEALVESIGEISDGDQADYSSDEGGFIRECDAEESGRHRVNAGNGIIEIASSDESEKMTRNGADSNDIIEVNSDSDGGGFVRADDESDHSGDFTVNAASRPRDVLPNDILRDETPNEEESDESESVDWEDGDGSGDGDIEVHGEKRNLPLRSSASDLSPSQKRLKASVESNDSLREPNAVGKNDNPTNDSDEIIEIASSDESVQMALNLDSTRAIRTQLDHNDDSDDSGGGFMMSSTPPRDMLKSDADDDIEWEDGDDGDPGQSVGEDDISGATHDVQSDADIEWEDGNDGSPGQSVHEDEKPQQQNESPNSLNGSKAVNCVESDDDIGWEDGDDDPGRPVDEDKEGAISDESSCTEVLLVRNKRDGMGENETKTSQSSNYRNNKRDDMGEHETKMSQSSNSDIDIVENDLVTSGQHASNDANTAALKNAQATASHLTDWAGRAVQRAIKAHLGEKEQNHDPAGYKDKQDIEVSIDTESHTHVLLPVLLPNEDTNEHVNTHHTNDLAQPAAKYPDIDTREFIDTSLDGLRTEDKLLREEENRRERDMDTVTDEMVEAVMHLLQLFGVPYLRAPAEAEAQCVELEKLGLVDGVVTEDSDAIVFGSNSVYRNIFDDKKYVEVYLSSDSKAIGLGLNEKIALAMLLGGDYTSGVKGVGIVNGMEILKAFPVTAGVEEGLTAFRKWLDGFDLENDEKEQNPNLLEFRRKHKSARSRWVVPKDFPAPNVLQAYSKPVVDNSREKFSWGMPDLEALRTFCFKTMGWEESETERVIVPVLDEMKNGSRQTRLDGYFMRLEDNIKFADIKSKRLKEVWNLKDGKNVGKQEDQEVNRTDKE